VSISVTGLINADGGARVASGYCYYYYLVYTGGVGAGGEIRLVAPVIAGNGTLSVYGGRNYCGRQDDAREWNPGAPGQIRLEAFQKNWGFAYYGPYTSGSPVSSYASPAPSPTVKVVSVGGAAVPSSPTGTFDVPDAVISTGSPVQVGIEATNVPPGTVPKLHISSFEAADQLIDCTPLVGTLQKSTATATVTFPAGFSRGFVRAKW
jgi:hypothetical protein